MAGVNVMLDTSIVVPILNQEAGLAEHLEGRKVYLSVVVLGELYYGAYHSSRSEVNLQRIDAFLPICTVLDCNVGTAAYYGQVKQMLYAKGRPIPENDIWIAAHAKQYNLTLISRDNHFQAIDHVLLEQW